MENSSVLLGYFAASLLLTVDNKWLLSRTEFAFPWFLTCIHIAVSGLGASLLLRLGQPKHRLDEQPEAKHSRRWTMAAYSVLYTVSIAISNVSLQYVTLSLHQMIRSACPAIGIAIEFALFGKRQPLAIALATVPVVVGVALASIGELGAGSGVTAFGVVLTVAGAVLASAKTIATSRIMVGPMRLEPIELLRSMAPFALAQCLLYSAAFGEFGRLRVFIGAQDAGLLPVLLAGLLCNGTLAFLLNWVSFVASKRNSPLTMAIAANVKQVLSICAAIAMFKTTVTALNAVGIAMALAGGCAYSWCNVRHQRKAFPEMLPYSVQTELPSPLPTKALLAL